MPFILRHLFQSAKADGPDTSLIRPSDWNAEHQFIVNAKRLIGNSEPTQGSAQEIEVAGLKLEGGILSNPAGAGGDVVIGTANPDLPDARVATDNAQIGWDTSTANQLKAFLVDHGIALDKFALGNIGEVYVIGGGGNTGLLAPGVVGQVLGANAAGSAVSWKYAGAGGAPHIVIQFRRGPGGADGAFTSGAWRTRALNDLIYDQYGMVTFPVATDDAFQLDAGTYVVEWSASGYKVGRHQTRLWNNTDSAILGIGSSAFSLAASGDVTWSNGIARFAIAASKAIVVQHQCETTGTFSVPSDFGINEVFTTVKAWRVN